MIEMAFVMYSNNPIKFDKSIPTIEMPEQQAITKTDAKRLESVSGGLIEDSSAISGMFFL